MDQFYQELRKIQKKERNNATLARVEEDFYSILQQYIYEIREEAYILETDPVTWFEYGQFNVFFGTTITDKTVGDGIPVYRIENWPTTISVAQDPLDYEYNGEVFNIEFYVFDHGGMTRCCYEINGEMRMLANFVPLVYDPDAKVIFGYGASADGSNGKFMKVYYSTSFNDLIGHEVTDPSIYGF